MSFVLWQLPPLKTITHYAALFPYTAQIKEQLELISTGSLDQIKMYATNSSITSADLPNTNQEILRQLKAWLVESDPSKQESMLQSLIAYMQKTYTRTTRCLPYGNQFFAASLDRALEIKNSELLHAYQALSQEIVTEKREAANNSDHGPTRIRT